MTRPKSPRRAHHVAGGEMTPAQFHAVAELIGSRDPARAAARMVLVDGMRPGEAATAAGVSPQSASNAVGRVRRAHESIRAAYSPPERARRTGATTPLPPR